MTNIISDGKELIKELKKAFERVIDKKLSKDERISKLGKEDLKIRLEDNEILDKFNEFTYSLINFIVDVKMDLPESTDDKRKRTLARASNYKDYFKDPSDDELLYGLKKA
ncbi:MAG: hypothetical protein GF383_03545 [Candidatus Lokiarchaeota archaeon]|nr:hypothetical protein [Candidatus Lokiarchaeota archaeon]MBD3338720.1 hypothetical protein [Candidatus Lokiarchaeota archaeon]